VRQSGRQRQALEIAEARVLKALADLCSDDVTPYPTGFDEDEGLPNLLLAGERPLGIVDVSVSGDGDEPIITMELLPVVDTPIGVKMVEAWSSGPPPARYRVRCWTFEWHGDDVRKRVIKYSVDVPREAMRALPALMLAGAAGWPLPSTAISAEND
jgi:hypothetical protein